jgi:hypothetical protein
MTDDRDAVVRLRAFAFLTEQRRRFGGSACTSGLPPARAPRLPAVLRHLPAPP